MSFVNTDFWRPLLWLDLETTGLETDHHEIIEIGAVMEGTLRSGGTFISEFEAKVLPQHVDRAHPKALEVNGFTSVEEWEAEGAVPLEEALFRFTKWVRAGARQCDRKGQIDGEYIANAIGPITGNQNVAFDIGFLKAAYKSFGLGDQFPMHYHSLDTQVLSYEHLKSLGQRSVSLGPVCDVLGISNEGAHSALIDARRARAVWYALRRSTWWQRFRWKRKITKINAARDAAKKESHT